MARRTMAEVLDENERLWTENEHLRSRIEWQDGDDDDEGDDDEDEADDDEEDDEDD